MASRGSIIQLLRGISRHNQFFYSLKGKNSTRKFSHVLQSRYHEIKYIELKSRLAEIPYINLVDKEADRVHDNLCSETDEGLECIMKWYSKIFNYNVRNNETLCPTIFLKSFCTYGFSMDDSSWKQFESDAWRSAAVVAWCVKMIIAYINMADDIMDKSILRNGKLCWYKKPDVGLGAINDSVLVLTGINKLLEMHFASSKCYMNLVHEFIKATRNTTYGQCMVGRYSVRNQKQRFHKLSFEWYETLSRYKSAPMCITLPVLLGMHLSERCTAEDYDFARKLCFKLGLYVQSQDDYADAFGSNEIELTGMVGNDIREGNCTWFSVKFLEQASEDMKKRFLESYGIDNEDAIENVLELYRKANLLEKFEEYDKNSYEDISTLIESRNDAKGYLFYELFTDIQNREK